jgi:hypothetical protein
MKRYFNIIAFLLVSATAFAQRQPNEDLVRAMRGGRWSLEADKTILSAGEVAQINVDVFIPPVVDRNTGETTTDGRVVHADEGAHAVANTDIPFIYHARNWKILAGGGSIDIVDEFNIRYTAPSQAPPNNTITISVELIPTGHDMPKVVLLKTLYFEDGENIFTLNDAAAGIDNLRLRQRTTGAKKGPANPSTVTAIDPAILARIPAAEREKLQKQKNQVDAAVEASDVNVISLTSNANALYDPASNTTVIKFLALTKDLSPGHPAGYAGGMAIITYTGGLTVGVHPFNGKSDAISVMPDGPRDPKTCTCSMQGNPSLQKLKCSGTLTITKMDGDFITGTISSTVWNNKGRDKVFTRGTVYGVFKIRKAYNDYHGSGH